MKYEEEMVPARRVASTSPTAQISTGEQDQIVPDFQLVWSPDEARFRALTEASADFLWITNADGTLLQESSGRSAFTGQEPTSDREWDWLQVFHPADREQLKALWLRGIATRQMVQGEARLRRHDGVYRTCHLRVKPVLDARGDVHECLGVGTDITERQRTEGNYTRLLMQQQETYQRLEEARASLQAVLDVLPVGVCIADREGHLTHMNAAARTVWGEQTPYATSFEQYQLYQGWWTKSGQAVAPQEWGMARAIQHGEVSLAEEIDILSFDGERKTMLHSAVPVRDESGSIIGGVVAILDISERKRLEKVLLERVSQLEAVFEAMADGVFVFNSEGQIIQMNQAADELLLTRAVDFAARSLQERLELLAVRDLQGQSLSQQDWPMRRILHGEVLKERNAVDVLLRTLDGRELQVRISGAPMHDQQGKVIGAVGIARDVTERRRLEQLERQQHAETQAHLALLQLILDELPGSVFLVRGPDARLLLANRAVANMWGATWQRGEPLEAFLSANGIRLLAADGQLLPLERLSMLRVVEQGERASQQQEIIRYADGTTLPILVNAVALDPADLNGLLAATFKQGGEGDERVALVVYEDVTALKKAEALKDEFIAVAAHELRTPLAALQGFAQTLMMQSRRGKGRALADWQLEALQEIDQAVFRLSELTEDLLDVTRLQAGRLALQLEPTDLVALARRVIKRLQMTTEDHTLSLHTTLPYIVVEADPRRLEQVLTNLIGNAIKYSPQSGSIEITVEQEEKNGAMLSVRDHGMGIPVQQQGRIFSRFMRADNARKSGISGTGLGLYLCRELVELHGGRIWFESIEEQGSTFFLALP